METHTHITAESRVVLSQAKRDRQSPPNNALMSGYVASMWTLTGESKEKAHSLLKTLSPVLGTLMVGMYGTSSSPRSAAIFAFLLLAPQCCGASGAALSEEDAIFKTLCLYIPPARGM